MERVGVFFCTGCGIGEALDIEALARRGRGVRRRTVHRTIRASAPRRASTACARPSTRRSSSGVLIAACSPRAKQRGVPLRPGAGRGRAGEPARAGRLVATRRAKKTRRCSPRTWSAWAASRLAKAKPADPRGRGGRARRCWSSAGAWPGWRRPAAAAGLGHAGRPGREARTGSAATLAGVRDQSPGAAALRRPAAQSRCPTCVAAVEARPADPRPQAGAGQGHRRPARPVRASRWRRRRGAESFRAGAIVQATGARPYDAGKLGHLGLRRVLRTSSPRTSWRRCWPRSELRRPSDGKLPRRVVFVQCAGSRDPEHLPYCSAECCGVTLQQVAAIHKGPPRGRDRHGLPDMRTPGQIERFYLAVQAQPGTPLHPRRGRGGGGQRPA